MSDPADDFIVVNLDEIAADLDAMASRVHELRDLAGGGAPDNGVPPGRRLARARARAGMTQSGLSEVSDVAVNTIINFEKGHTKPRMKTLMRLAEAVGIPWEVLQEEDDG